MFTDHALIFKTQGKQYSSGSKQLIIIINMGMEICSSVQISMEALYYYYLCETQAS